MKWLVGTLLVAATSLGLMAGCGDDVRGRLKILVAPLHAGRNPTQDPFVLVDRVEIGLTDAEGVFRSLGSAAPLGRFGPGLIGAAGIGAPTLRGVNDRGRPVSLGFGDVLDVSAGLDAVVSIPFARVDHAVARRVRAADRARPDLFAAMPPALLLDATHLEQGAIGSPADAGCLVWLLWQGDRLLIRARVWDEVVQAAGDGQALDAGDALIFMIDGASDGQDGGADDRLITIAADGRVEPAEAVEALTVEALAGGYAVSFELPLAAGGKNLPLGFDLRLVDADGAGEPTLLTWVFDPRSEGQLPVAANFGRLILGVPLLDLLAGGGQAEFFKADGPVRLAGNWSGDALHLDLQIDDDEVLADADRVEIWFDLTNGESSGAAIRFCRLSISAGGVVEPACGPDLANVTGAGLAFSGSARATIGQGAYSVSLDLPWADMQLSEQPQRGWFLGAEIVIIDEDASGQTISSWSDSPERADLWSEIRLFSAE